MRGLIRVFDRRDRRITARIDAMANELTAFELVEPKPFLETEADDIAHRIETLMIERLNRQDRIAGLKEEIAFLGVEVADICTAIEAQEAAAKVLAGQRGVLVAAE